jgi:Ran-binding protein 1
MAAEQVVGGDSTATYTPLVTGLTEKKTSTGEEEEAVIYKERARLYRFDKELNEWKERGTGSVKILYRPSTKRCRLILRQEKTLKVCMNHEVAPALELTANVGSDRTWNWATDDYASEEPVFESFAIKFKSAEIAAAFKAKHDFARQVNDGKATYEADAKANDEPVGDDAKADDSAATTAAAATETANPWVKILDGVAYERLTQEQLKSLWDTFDADSSGFIDAAELSNLISGLFKAMVDKLDNSGELMDALQQVVPSISAAALKDLDKNDDGKISWEEFQAMDDIKGAMHTS